MESPPSPKIHSLRGQCAERTLWRGEPETQIPSQHPKWQGSAATTESVGCRLPTGQLDFLSIVQVEVENRWFLTARLCSLALEQVWHTMLASDRGVYASDGDGETVTSPLVRTTRLATAYRRYLASADAPRFAAEVDEYYCGATLATLLRRGDVEMRRAAALALGMLGDRSAVEPLGRSLADDDRGVRLAADDSFRALLVRDAAPLHHQQLLQVMHLNDGGEYAAALAPTMILVDQASKYAEAHHQLAICWHGLENYVQAEAAYVACLWYCRFHYPAWQGLARCRQLLGEHQQAIAALERCLEICPDVETARLQLRMLRRRHRRSDA